MLGSVMLWPMPLVLGAASFVTARITIALLDDREEPIGLRKWLLYPSLLAVDIPVLVVVATGPTPSLVEFFNSYGSENAANSLAEFVGTSPQVAAAGTIALALGCWWALIGLLAIQFTATIRSVFRPFGDGFGRRHATRLALAGVVLAVAGLAALTLPRFLVATVSAQERPRLTFAVASVKRNVSGDPGGSVRIDPGNRLVVTNIAVVGLVRHAYGTQRWEMVPGGNLPSWMQTEKWDIQAKAADGATAEQVSEMFKNLLADRFKLVANRELREIPVYALVRARADGRLGPQLRPSPVDCEQDPACGIRDLLGNITMNGVAWANFPRIISLAAGRYIVDKTGITGPVDLQLTWSPDQPVAVAPRTIRRRCSPPFRISWGCGSNQAKHRLKYWLFDRQNGRPRIRRPQGSIRRRPLDGVDDHHAERSAVRDEFEAELLLDRREDRRRIFGS
jgi:uncharacterized protein (TIGR03435 family)